MITNDAIRTWLENAVDDYRQERLRHVVDVLGMMEACAAHFGIEFPNEDLEELAYEIADAHGDEPADREVAR